jgi:hypothetical protein
MSFLNSIVIGDHFLRKAKIRMGTLYPRIARFGDGSFEDTLETTLVGLENRINEKTEGTLLTFPLKLLLGYEN